MGCGCSDKSSTNYRNYTCGSTKPLSIQATAIAIPGITGLTGPQGPAGDNAVLATLTNEACALRANSAGIVSNYTSCTTLYELWDGDTQLTVPVASTSFSVIGYPALTAALSQSGDGVLLTVTGGIAAGENSGHVDISYTYNAHQYVKRFEIVKVCDGANGTNGLPGVVGTPADQFKFKGYLTTPPIAPVNLDWYINPNTGIAYFYDSVTVTWQLMYRSADMGATYTNTIAPAGLNKTLTTSDAKQQYITGTATLVAPVVIAPTAGVWTDGYCFRVFYNAAITLGGNTVTIFGYVLGSDQALNGGLILDCTYITGTGWNVVVEQSALALNNPKIYHAVLTENANPVLDPTVVIVYNTLGEDPIWTQTAPGIYAGTTIQDRYMTNKTICHVQKGVGSVPADLGIVYATQKITEIWTTDCGTGLTAPLLMTTATVTILVYP